MKNCLYCKIEFIPKKPFAKFCSDKCRVYFSRSKKIVTNNHVNNLNTKPEVKLTTETKKLSELTSFERMRNAKLGIK